MNNPDLQYCWDNTRAMTGLEVKDHLHDLMVHQFANYLIQKLFEAGNQEQRTELLLLLVSSEQKFLNVLPLLKPIAVTLINNTHGHHIIEHCLNKFSNEDTKHLVDEIIKHCIDTATDKSGWCVLQQFLAHAKAEAMERLLAEITANAFIHSKHPSGFVFLNRFLFKRVFISQNQQIWIIKPI
ncbi:putative pumilio homolog 8, chloroplastic [Durio zibethinus]|uniref:Pumilio homolog 8, chloroplastic n=1 Tax=Durio zibethinus TaxID=66656 RepID=A0A6P6AB54_DURZI|nr:putative pumilio homolog 8, chloroplastic [Durio zibethinus]